MTATASESDPPRDRRAAGLALSLALVASLHFGVARWYDAERAGHEHGLVTHPALPFAALPFLPGLLARSGLTSPAGPYRAELAGGGVSVLVYAGPLVWWWKRPGFPRRRRRLE